MSAVTFNNKGRLGNYLFECATAMSYAIDYNLNFTIPNPKKSNFWNPIYFSHLYTGSTAESSVLIKEAEYFNYKKIPFKEAWRKQNIILDGYFQSEHYFKHNIDKIKEAWKIESSVRNSDFVGVHIRRGDYLSYPDKHVLLNKEWVLKAVALFPGHKFAFFSDDVEWLTENILPNIETAYTFSTSKNPLDDFYALTSCKHQIISPSTFGWWAAYLNPNPDKKIVITNNWFQPTFKDNGNNIIPDNWIKLPL